MRDDSQRRPRLDERRLSALPPDVRVPTYARAETRIGIVHFGPGSFHRAHQAAYIDDLLVDAPDWAICAVSLHSAGVREALAPQDGLYALELLGEAPQLRVIGAIREVLCAPEQQDTVLTRLSDPAVRLVTLTITEKGYCLGSDGLDFAHPDIAHDLSEPNTPRSAIGYLVEGLRRRHAQGITPYTVLSCDNLPDNGGTLRRAALHYAARIDPAFAAWMEDAVAFPSSMVDSITPATDDASRARVEAGLGCVDAWPVQREPYAHWVVEDHFCSARPPLERVGVTLSRDIAGHDRAKLRLLNAPHSALAYLGSLMGIETVAEAMQNHVLAGFVEQLMRQHLAPTLALPSGFDASAYIDAILDRFHNPAIRHRLAQIAWDGSQKMPVRLLAAIRDAHAAGRAVDTLCLPVAAWLHYVRRQSKAGAVLVDPLSMQLATLGAAATGNADADIANFLQLDAVFGSLSEASWFVHALHAAYVTLGDAGPDAVSRALMRA